MDIKKPGLTKRIDTKESDFSIFPHDGDPLQAVAGDLQGHKVKPSDMQPKTATSMLKTTPWVNPDGVVKSEEELRETVKSWKPSDWENYLVSLETYQREEYLGKSKTVEQLSNEDYTAGLVELFYLDEYPNLTREVGNILSTLSERQRVILRLRYWENRTFQQIGTILGIKHQSVQDSLKRSHAKIEKQLKMIAAKKAWKVAVEETGP